MSLSHVIRAIFLLFFLPTFFKDESLSQLAFLFLIPYEDHFKIGILDGIFFYLDYMISILVI